MTYPSLRVTFSLLVLLPLLTATQLCAEEHSKSESEQVASTMVYFESLRALCGSEFSGEMTFPVDGQDDFAGKTLVARFASCSDSEVRVPFLVGEDRSRTWVFSKTESGLHLRHDHRHADGTPDEVTDYGGNSSAAGTPLSQSFAADQYTKTLIPAAATNVWAVSFNTQLDELTYHLERHGKPRFTAVLSRTK